MALPLAAQTRDETRQIPQNTSLPLQATQSQGILQLDSFAPYNKDQLDVKNMHSYGRMPRMCPNAGMGCLGTLEHAHSLAEKNMCRCD
jgi:hypothetical protein